jgi:acyl-ACP thioesterase
VSGEHNELSARAPKVRVFTHPGQPGFRDCAPSGRMRLDALADWLQDVAYADVADAGLDSAAVWVVRRTRIRVNRFPQFGESFAVTTFCSGLGRMWAERRTDIVRADAGAVDDPGASDGSGDPGNADVADVQAVSIWVHLDAEHWRPSPLTEAELRTYGGATPSRRVSARLRHPVPDALTGGEPWIFRATDCDIAAHVNNAAYWQPFEEELLAAPDPERLDVDIEYRTPAQPGVKRVVRNGRYRWIVGDEDELHASIMVGADDGR